MNLHKAKRGIRPGWARIREAEDLLRLHKEKPLKHRHALAACHSCFDPLNQVPWLGALQKYVYRVYCINTELKTEGRTRDFDDILEDDYIENHLFYCVKATLEAKRRLSIARTWQLPLCIERSSITTELDTICDGSWSILAGSASLTYLVQRYKWKDEDQVSIHLYGGQVALNPMLKPHHQLSSELGGMQLAQKATDTALESLKDFNLAPPARLTSDSQTALTLCTKPAITLELGVGLLVARIQETFGGGSEDSGLHFAPGDLFKHSVDLLTRYDRKIAEKIGEEFYSPSFLKPKIRDRMTTPIVDMVRTADDRLPHKNPKVMRYAMYGSGPKGNLFASSNPPDAPGGKAGRGEPFQASKLQSSGKGALKQTQLCEEQCGTCDVGEPVFHPADTRVLTKAREKRRLN